LQVTVNDSAALAEEDVLRARFYGLLASLLARAPSVSILDQLKSLGGDDTDIGMALAALGEAAAAATPEIAEDEYNALFIGVTQGELLPFASHYLTGFLYEQPLANLRGAMAELKIARAEGVGEPEDHIAAILEMMHGLIVGSFAGPADLKTQKSFFDAHVATWAPRFFEDLEAAENAALYRPVGTLGRLFLTIEGEAFAMG